MPGECENSISKDSVFDWGNSSWFRRSSGSLKGSFTGGGSACDEPKVQVSRYDPRTMNRISSDLVDIDDVSSGESDDDDAVVGSASGKGSGHVVKGKSLCWRQTLIIVSLVGIIVAASAAIGYTVIVGNRGPDTGRGAPAYSVAAEDGSAVTEESEQDMLELAERIVMACSESSLDADMSGCQHLCEHKMCCFERGEYSCEDDESKACAVHAACEALMEDI